jgi:hypothetical protein
MLLILFILVDVAYFTTVFLYLDKAQKNALENPKSVYPWLLCLVANKGNKQPCLEKAQHIFARMPVVVAVLFLLGVSLLRALVRTCSLTLAQATGIQVFLLMARVPMLGAWRDLFVNLIHGKKREFISLDARQMTPDISKIPMTKVTTPNAPSQTPASPPAASPPVARPGGYTSGTTAGRPSEDYFSIYSKEKELEREYKTPSRSFSSPNSPAVRNTVEFWDPRSGDGRYGLGLHPPGTPERNWFEGRKI